MRCKTLGVRRSLKRDQNSFFLHSVNGWKISFSNITTAKKLEDDAEKNCITKQLLNPS